MPRKSQSKNEDLSEPPSSIDPYTTLGVDKNASSDQIKTAYRKAALRHHPDKAKNEEKDEANRRFQEIALAYAILSDERRRKRYDATGNTAESLNADDDDFDWVDYFREQTKAMVDGEMIEKIKREYQGSPEEREDVLRVYTESEGDMDAIYEEIMCSNVLDDDKRIRGYINQALEAGEVEGFKAYTKESKSKRKRRVEDAKGEANEAMAMAEELGVKDQLFGKGKAKGGGEDALQALILQRQQDRSASFMDQLEAKYGAGKKSKRKVDEPPEEMFQQNAKKSKGRK